MQLRTWVWVFAGMLALTFATGYVKQRVGWDGVMAAESTARDRALEAADRLVDLYWNDKLNMFNNQYPCNDCNGQFHYWWQAHGVDTLLDFYELTGDEKYTQLVHDMYRGLHLRNGGHLFNDFYDDELWMGLAWLRAHELTDNPAYLRTATALWNDIIAGWNDHYGGGISWRKSQRDYKNTPANGPAAILAARFYRLTGDESYLDWAKKIYTWLQDHMVDPETGIVWDGVNRTGDGQIDKGWLFTYNQGTVIGAAVELWRVTGDETYLDDARRTADRTLKTMTVNMDVFPDEGQGDGGLFKGILVRYLRELWRETSDDDILNSFRRQADSVWQARSRQGLSGPRWYGITFGGTIDLSTQLSANKLFNMTALMEEP